jgi:hypothetical protein
MSLLLLLFQELVTAYQWLSDHFIVIQAGGSSTDLVDLQYVLQQAKAAWLR